MDPIHTIEEILPTISLLFSIIALLLTLKGRQW